MTVTPFQDTVSWATKERNDWEICCLQLRFMVLYAIRNEISRFRVVKTRKRKIDIEIFCSLIMTLCRFYQANKKKNKNRQNLVKASWLGNLVTRNRPDTKDNQKQRILSIIF